MYEPHSGDPLTITDLDNILDSIRIRQEKFENESFETSFKIVMFNIGNRYATVHCINGEWSGMKQELNWGNSTDIPKCPNGHVMTESGGLRIGWIREEF